MGSWVVLEPKSGMASISGVRLLVRSPFADSTRDEPFPQPYLSESIFSAQFLSTGPPGTGPVSGEWVDMVALEGPLVRVRSPACVQP